jgi:hypothetical protein
MADIWERKWEVYSAQMPGNGYLGPGVFELAAVPDALDPSQVDFYRVTVCKGMHACWNGLRLFPRGSEKAQKLRPVLPTWTNSVDREWLDAADAHRAAFGSTDFFPGIHPKILRLEGDIFPIGQAEALTLVCVDLAAEDGDMLVVILKSDRPHPDEDGTAHGGTPH